jgi:hypothetical protein
MEDLTLPSVGGSLKKWVYCASILPKTLGPCYMQGPEKTIKKLGTKKKQKQSSPT